MRQDEFSTKVNRLFAEGNWGEARDFLLTGLVAKPKDHWLLTRLGTTYYEERNYSEALKFAEKAFTLAPRCPLVLWDYAGTLAANGRLKEAVKVYGWLILRGQHAIANNECGEGEEWAAGLIADCWFRLGLCYESLQDKAKAINCLEKYLGERHEGLASLYTRKDAIRRLIKLGAP